MYEKANEPSVTSLKQNCKSFRLQQHRNTHKISQTLTKWSTGSLGAKMGV